MVVEPRCGHLSMAGLVHPDGQHFADVGQDRPDQPDHRMRSGKIRTTAMGTGATTVLHAVLTS